MAGLSHVRRHLSARVAARAEALDLLLPLFCESLTLREIAERVGWSEKMVYHYWRVVRDGLGITNGQGHVSTDRLAFLRIVLGLDPCFCQEKVRAA